MSDHAAWDKYSLVKRGRSTALENAAGLGKGRRMSWPVSNGDIGVCVYIGEAKFPPKLYESECHQCCVPRGSNTSARPRV